MSMPRIVAIGGSAGAVEPLLLLTRSLPSDFPAPICVVLHVPAHAPSVLSRLIHRGQRLQALPPEEGEAVQPGRVYVAPPDSHLLVRDGRIRLTRGPAENGSRPAIDPLFRSAAQAYGRAAIGVVLSGSLGDGTAGLYAIKEAGGLTVVQSPDEAMYGSMPRSALANVVIDHVVSIADLPELLVRLVRAPPPRPKLARHADGRAMETAEIAQHGPTQAPARQEAADDLSAFACPDCRAVLWENMDGELTRFRCRVGHVYLPDSLAVAQSSSLEDALWVALRTLRESGALAGRLAERAKARNMSIVAEAYERRAQEARERGRVIEAVLRKGKLVADDHGN